MNYRVGLGFDVHRFAKARKPLILGGINLACGLSLEAVSDGDVLLHTINDALCGACSFGDIGDYFPPSKTQKRLNSKVISNFILKKMANKFEIINIDATIITEKPKLAPYKDRIIRSLEKIFRAKNINLKIKSKEGLDILGSKKAISCFAVALVKPC
jgi:2-C-methyl-D-erythritol 2,4-cyclodiphosphate synthase